MFLNILSFNFVQTPNKSLRLRRFRRSYANCPVVVPITVKIALLILLDVCALFKVATFLFLQLFVPNFKNLLFNSLITGWSLENLPYLSSCSLSPWCRFWRILSNVSRGIKSDITCTNVSGASPNTFYCLETYGTH